ncbi:hypothetical protein GCM10020358_24880 [Amorphoplanes nipponensis]|uniref:Uncharacterized protein n=1 Tax=Actinoplanes nipponensis TaxID=135950 RepID=A0A919MQQ7_9ACTN|nr:hypothetical protein [Actinoplanes nipponensis]GIE53407.1 hypothetical protein Ani05nite_69410 [Actinoplanes nipponensis]
MSHEPRSVIPSSETGGAEAILRKVLYESRQDVSEASQLASDAARDPLVEGLRHGLQVPDADAAAASTETVDIAGQALSVLAADPAYRRAVNAVRSGSGGGVRSHDRDFAVDPISFVSAATLALVVLNMYVKLERDKNGQWIFEFRLNPASKAIQAELLKLMRALLELVQSR